MSYPGGKGASGVVQQIINQIPPHRLYVEAFLGGGAVFNAKAPAASSLLIEKDSVVVANWRNLVASPEVQLVDGDALQILSSFPWVGDEFVYLDPPYHPDTRTKKQIYRCELEHADHVHLLELLASLPVPFALSGYRNALYDGAAAVNGWRRIDFQAMTRGGVRTESLWMNYAAPARIAETTYAGSGFRERERIKRKATRWANKLRALPAIEQQAILAMLATAATTDSSDTRSRTAPAGAGILENENGSMAIC